MSDQSTAPYHYNLPLRMTIVSNKFYSNTNSIQIIRIYILDKYQVRPCSTEQGKKSQRVIRENSKIKIWRKHTISHLQFGIILNMHHANIVIDNGTSDNVVVGTNV